MPTYIALLRGINVGGNKSVPMERLRGLCEDLGFDHVQTYIQSGNVVFESAKSTNEALSRKIGKRIAGEFGFDVPVIVRTPAELKAVLGKKPFPALKSADPARFVVFFLSDKPASSAAKKLDDLPKGQDLLKLIGSELYLYCPNGIGKSKLAATDFKKLLSVDATARNVNTVNKLFEMASG